MYLLTGVGKFSSKYISDDCLDDLLLELKIEKEKRRRKKETPSAKKKSLSITQKSKNFNVRIAPFATLIALILSALGLLVNYLK